ncbi:MAG: hypothetical protein JO081_05445 [Alphaproteobacteria bacterium]|nr:hypothetical protein [Alphaproteobacteria bacterium]
MSGVRGRAMTGYPHHERDPVCWRVERIGPPADVFGRNRTGGRRSRALSLWLKRLHEPADASAYRICPIGDDE